MGIAKGALRARVGGVLLTAALLGLLGIVPSAQAAPKGVVGFFGSPDALGGSLGGQFAINTMLSSTGTAPMGVAVNDASGAVYVADTQNNRVQRFDADGNFEWALGFDVIAPGKPGNIPQNERQQVALGGSPTGGSFILRYPANTDTTESIPFNASVAQVQAALDGLSTLGAGNTEVTLAPGGDPGGGATAGGPWIIDFKGALADVNAVAFNGTAAALTPSGSVVVSTLVDGAGFVEKCTVAADCKAGTPVRSGGNRDTFGTSVPGGGFAIPQGLALDQGTGDLYVADAAYARIQKLDEDGNFIRAWGAGVVKSGSAQADEQQRLTVDAASGQYKLSFGLATSVDIEWNETAAGVESKLNALSTIGGAGGSVTVSGGPGGAGGAEPYLVAFGGTLADTDLAQLTASAGTTPLGGGAGVAVATLNEGAEGFEVCTVAADCDKGKSPIPAIGGSFSGQFAIGYAAVVPAGAPNAGNVIVGDAASRRVQEFSPSGQFVRTFGWDVVASGPGNAGSGFEVCAAGDFDICQSGVTGNGSGQFATGTSTTLNPNMRVAADASGAIYTVEPSTNFRVQKFTPSGGSLTPSLFNPTISSLPGEAPAASFPLSGASTADRPTDIAIDGAGNLLVAKACTAAHCPGAGTSNERRIYEFSPAGALLETHLAGAGVTSLNGLALKSSGEPAYLTTATPKVGVLILGAPIPPEASIEPTTEVGAHSATLHGTVDPNGGGSQHTLYRFEYSADGGSSWSKAPVPDADAGSGEAPVAVSQSISGLQANTQFKVRLAAIKGGGVPVNSTGGAGDFLTLPAAPDAETQNAWWDGNTAELNLKAKIRPQGLPTTYYFEYGAADCSTNPCAAYPVSKEAMAGEGGEQVVIQRIPGLDTSVSYHYRVVAVNAAGTTEGLDRTAGPGLATVACPNQVLREENDSTDLPQCRAIEFLSEGETNGLGITALKAISENGERVVLEAQTYGEPKSLVTQFTPFAANRGVDGWEVGGLGPDPAAGTVRSLGGAGYLSADLSTALWPQSTPERDRFGEIQWSFSTINGPAQAALPYLTPLQSSGLVNGNYPPAIRFRGASADLSSFVFDREPSVVGNDVTYVPGEPLIPRSTNLYLVTEAGPSAILSLANVDPAGSLIANSCGVGLGGIRDGKGGSTKRAVSSDGSVIYFNARPGAPTNGTCTSSSFPLRLYKRIEGTSTVEVSKSQCTRTVPTPCSAANGDDLYLDASTDGEVVVFASPRQLTDSDEDATSDLYLYDATPPPGQPTLVQVSAGEVTAGHPKVGSGALADRFAESASDGSRVYFTAKGQLTPDATAGARNLFVFQRDDGHPAGRISLIGGLAAADDPRGASYALPFAGPGGSGPGDGRYLLFVSAARLSPDDDDGSADLYRHDDDAGQTLCLSCQGDGDDDVRIAGNIIGEVNTSPAWVQESRVATEDASAVVFTTPEALLPGDDNSAEDVYEWRAGALSLISGAAGEAGVYPGDALISPNGKSIAFMTDAAIHPSDENSSKDLYAAVAGGGFPLPVVPRSRCEDGQACRGSAPGPPSTEAPGSANFSGTGNVVPPKACKKGQVRKKGRCVSKKQAKRHGKKHKRETKHKKRGGNR